VRLALVPLAFLLLIIAVIIAAAPIIFVNAELTANMSGDPYEDEYNATVGLEQVGLSMLWVIGGLIVLAGVLIMGYWLGGPW